jgi:hypothetical protein
MSKKRSLIIIFNITVALQKGHFRRHWPRNKTLSQFAGTMKFLPEAKHSSGHVILMATHAELLPATNNNKIPQKRKLPVFNHK